MATRPIFDLCHATLKTVTVAPTKTSTYGYPQTFTLASDGSLLTEDSASGAAADAICVEGVAGSTTTAGKQCLVALLSGGSILPVKVGTGGCTVGLWAKIVSDGATDSGTLGGGTTLVNVIGKFVQTGSAGDIVGMQPAPFAAVKA